jgi:PAS domain S-box-containing protein
MKFSILPKILVISVAFATIAALFKAARRGRQPAQEDTERRRFEERTRLLAHALESTNEMVSVTDLDDRFTFVNQAFLRTYGYTAEEVIGQTPALLQSPGVPDAVLEEILRESRLSGWQGEMINRRKDGSEFPIGLGTSLIRDLQGRPVGLVGVAHNLTERIQAAKALREAEEHTRFALEASRAGTWDADLRTGVARWSETCEVMHGMAPGTFGGSFDAFIAAVHPDDREQLLQTIDRATREHTDVRIEYRTVLHDGSIRWIGNFGRFFYDENGAPTRGAGVATEVTERHLLEDQFRHAQKMDAVGQLAGGIAHDFNNLLTAIIGFAGIIADSLPETDERRSDVTEITRAAERAAALTRQLLAFSRKQIIAPRVVHLGDIVSGLAPMLQRLLGETVELRTVVADRRFVKADIVQLEQVLVSLAVNARDAMREGGLLTLETADVTLDEEFVRQHPTASPGPYVMLAVEDNGHGMNDEMQRRIFEPFFTTNPMNRGTGLGLASVYGIVQQSGGHIWVESEVGKGTRFTIYLPRTEAAAESDPDTARHEPRVGTETILLVEDEEAVRDFVYKVLTRQGYRVHAMPDSKHAIAFAQAHTGVIELVLTDVILPDINGRAMATRVESCHPEARVLFMSGYTDDAIVRHGVLDPGTWLLHKPFTPRELLQKIQEVLSTEPAAQNTPTG